MHTKSVIKTNEITVNERVRGEMGDLDGLANSIREFGLIQPIVLSEIPDIDKPHTGLVTTLIAGGRRLEALKRAGVTELEHGVHFIWRDEHGEDVELRLKAIELEENVKRKDLTWHEELIAKKALFDLMQKIHGPDIAGQKPRYTAGMTTSGFGINKLAAMLGESAGKTSQDIQLATAVEKIPQLKSADTKTSALRQLGILEVIIDMATSKKPEAKDKLWTLYEGDFRENVDKVPKNSVDLVYTDLPFGVDLAKMSKHARGVVDYSDSRDSILEQLSELANHAYGVLRQDRYAVFYFGFNYYGRLLDALRAAGFTVGPVPIVWYKHTRSTENPNTRYANAYDPALVAMKGSPVFIRPGMTNVIDIKALPPSSKLQIAQQPVELVQRFIGDMTVEGATIVDFMCGSGTTGVAAVKMKRRVILFEKHPAAAEIARRRLESL